MQISNLFKNGREEGKTRRSSMVRRTNSETHSLKQRLKKFLLNILEDLRGIVYVNL